MNQTPDLGLLVRCRWRPPRRKFGDALREAQVLANEFFKCGSLRPTRPVSAGRATLGFHDLGLRCRAAPLRGLTCHGSRSRTRRRCWADTVVLGQQTVHVSVHFHFRLAWVSHWLNLRQGRFVDYLKGRSGLVHCNVKILCGWRNIYRVGRASSHGASVRQFPGKCFLNGRLCDRASPFIYNLGHRSGSRYRAGISHALIVLESSGRMEFCLSNRGCFSCCCRLLGGQFGCCSCFRMRPSWAPALLATLASDS